MNSALLKGMIMMEGDKMSDLAVKLDLSNACLSNKMNGKTDWKAKEIKAIRDNYHLSNEDIIKIFFN